MQVQSVYLNKCATVAAVPERLIIEWGRQRYPGARILRPSTEQRLCVVVSQSNKFVRPRPTADSEPHLI
jgi:hypothetical protein